jgi:hypothetical protein
MSRGVGRLREKALAERATVRSDAWTLSCGVMSTGSYNLLQKPQVSRQHHKLGSAGMSHPGTSDALPCDRMSLICARHCPLPSFASPPPQDHLPSFPLDPPLDAPQSARSHALVWLIRLPAQLELVHLECAEQCAGRQCEGDLCRAGGARVCIGARERALQQRSAARGSGRQRPAQQAPRGYVRPLATARRGAARGAGRARTKVQLDGDVVQRGGAWGERQFERA